MARSAASGRSASSNRTSVQDMNSSLAFYGNSGIDKRVNLTTPLQTGVADSLTVGCWVKPYKTSNNQTILLDGFDYGGNLGYLLNINPTLAPTIFIGSSSYSSGVRISSAQWQYLVFEISGTTGNIYINNMTTPIFTVTIARKASGGASCYYGAESSNSNTLLGNLKDIFAYKGVLTAAQKTTLMNGGTLPDVTLNFRHSLNEGAGPTAYDTSGNGNNGTITNGTWVSDTPSQKRKTVNDNLVYNGDFEYAPPFVAATTTSARWIDGTSGGSTKNTLFGWFCNQIGTNGYLKFTSPSISGSNSMEISNGTSGQITSVYSSIASSAGIPTNFVLLPSTSYTLTYKLKTTVVSGSGGTVRVMVSQRNGSGSMAMDNSLDAVSTTSATTAYTLTFTTSASTRYGLIKIEIDGTHVAIAQIDDIVLKPTTPTTRGTA